jgi:phosphatidylglycerophosphate synthase
MGGNEHFLYDTAAQLLILRVTPPPLSPALVVLLPGPDVRVLGMSARVRNERVAARAGAIVVSPASLAEDGEGAAVRVPSDRLIDLGLFPLALSAALLDVSTAASRRRVAWHILRRTAKATDGWVSSHLNRPISCVVSFALLSLGLSASHASWLTLLVGLGAAALAAQPGYAAFVSAGVLFQLASVLDGVDGEMARATLTESESGARLDALVDQITYVACLVGVTVGWVRGGGGPWAIVWTSVVAVALVLSLIRGGRFVSRHAPNASFVFIDRSVRRAARDSGRAGLSLAAGAFALLRRDVFAMVFLAVALTGQRAFVPALVACGIVLANATLTWYRRDLADAALAERYGEPRRHES